MLNRDCTSASKSYYKSTKLIGLESKSCMMSLPWGNKILQTMKKLGEGQKIALIRHSERPSFDNLPHGQWDSVELTSEGVSAAKEFGKVLGEQSISKDFAIFGWGLKRCQMTAAAISEGATYAGCRISGPFQTSFKSPIANRSEYEKALQSGGWNEFVDNWLANTDPLQKAMVPIDEYSREIYGALLSKHLNGSNHTTIIATHDLHILPLARYCFPDSSRYVDYLDGIVLSFDGKNVTVGQDGDLLKVGYGEFLSQNKEK